jgi:hypothetical protein
MSRYSQIQTTLGPNPVLDLKDRQPRYRTVIYPEIVRDIRDIYIFTRVGDRYDSLAQSYYKDSSLWWVISTANETPSDSLLPDIGIQIRIPSPTRINAIVSNYENLNN